MPTPPHTLEFVPNASLELDVYMSVNCPGGGPQRHHVATVCQPAGENPGLKFVGILGVNAVEEICQAVKQGKHRPALDAMTGDVVYAGWVVTDPGNDRRGGYARNDKGEEHRLCYLCGHPDVAHPWTGPPEFKRGKCPPGNPIYQEAADVQPAPGPG